MSGTTDLSYAEFHQRLGAYLIDLIVCLPLALLFMAVVERPIIIGVLLQHSDGPINISARYSTMSASLKIAVFLLFFASIWIPSSFYYALMESRGWRATLGKKALGLTTAGTDGNRVSFGRAMVRYYVKALVLVVPFGFIAILPLFGGRRQGAHDRMTGIVVVVSGKSSS